MSFKVALYPHGEVTKLPPAVFEAGRRAADLIAAVTLPETGAWDIRNRYVDLKDLRVRQGIGTVSLDMTKLPVSRFEAMVGFAGNPLFDEDDVELSLTALPAAGVALVNGSRDASGDSLFAGTANSIGTLLGASACRRDKCLMHDSAAASLLEAVPANNLPTEFCADTRKELLHSVSEYIDLTMMRLETVQDSQIDTGFSL